MIDTRSLAVVAATDTGRGAPRLMAPVIDDLGRAAALLLEKAPALRVGILTGFFIPRAQPPAAETDGPLGAVQLAAMITALGGAATVISDSHCAASIQGFLGAAGPVGDHWRRPDLVVADSPAEISLNLTLVISIERPGRSADGTYRNMFGTDISAFCPPLDDWFGSVHVPTIAIGDGGNEVGMGRLDPRLIADVVTDGARIRSVVTTGALIVGGTSNWGAHALCAAVAAGASRTAARQVLAEAWCRRVLEGGVAAGAVDGVSAARKPSVDGLRWRDYWKVPRELNRIALGDS